LSDRVLARSAISSDGYQRVSVVRVGAPDCVMTVLISRSCSSNVNVEVLPPWHAVPSQRASVTRRVTLPSESKDWQVSCGSPGDAHVSLVSV
jgi:hypothetical protein